MINMIASVGRNGEIGKDGKLIWPIKKDLKFFRDTTIGCDVIMGMRTFNSLPHLLEGRKNIVLTHRNKIIEGAEIRSYIKGLVCEYRNKDAFVIGGESVYSDFLEYASNIYLTEIDDDCILADAFFPKFNKDNYDKEILFEDYDDQMDVFYKHTLYKRR